MVSWYTLVLWPWQVSAHIIENWLSRGHHYKYVLSPFLPSLATSMGGDVENEKYWLSQMKKMVSWYTQELWPWQGWAHIIENWLSRGNNYKYILSPFLPSLTTSMGGDVENEMYWLSQMKKMVSWYTQELWPWQVWAHIIENWLSRGHHYMYLLSPFLPSLATSMEGDVEN